MLVYGDRAVRTTPTQLLREITSGLLAAEGAAAGPDRHDLLTRAFLDAAGLAQGVADAEFDQRGLDDLSPAQDACMALLLTLARKLTASAWSDFQAVGPGVAPELMQLAVLPLPPEIAVKAPEGHAFYAVYPEAYLKAAAEHAWPATPMVIGIRSIGAGLAALVAGVTGAQTVITVRPGGHPFRREVAVTARIAALIREHRGPFAIVDEGPGLSGSSFGAVADLLESLGVARDRIVFMPSHRGEPGPEAEPAHAARWAISTRAVATFEDLAAEQPLSQWFGELTGEISSVENLSGGAWRSRVGAGPSLPADPARERLKFLLNTASGVWLARFAGLGRAGAEKLERAQALHRAGLTPEPLALRRGFLIERWEEGAVGADVARAALVERLAAYIAFRATMPAPPEAGAGLAELAEMVRANAGEALGPDAAAAVEPTLSAAAGAPGRRVWTDGRLHAWEWRLTPDGLLLKTDAHDHASGHDLVGAQEIGWDIAGARCEFGLEAAETEQVLAAIEAASGERPGAARLAFFDLAYAAFQVGLWSLASNGAEEARRYVRRLADLAGLPESAD